MVVDVRLGLHVGHQRVKDVLALVLELHRLRHHASGRGYAFLADHVIELDGINPQIASRLTSAFLDWRRFDPARQDRMRAQLERIAGTQGLSKDVFEIVRKGLGQPQTATA